MSEISENEIKSMTKEQNYMRGYFDGKQDILEKIRAEIEELKPNNPNFKGYYEQNVALNKVLDIIDKYKAEKEYKAEVITRGNCMMCGKELTEGLFFCKECENKANDRK